MCEVHQSSLLHNRIDQATQSQHSQWRYSGDVSIIEIP